MSSTPVSGGWQSIRRRLPLLTTALLSIAVVAISWSAYVEMKGSLVAAAGQRVISVSQEVATAFGTSNARLQHDGSPLSHDSTLRHALSRSTPQSLSAARRRFQTELQSNKQIAALELLTTRGTLMLAVGDAQNPAFASPSGGSDASPVWPLIAAHDTMYTDSRLPIIAPPAETLGYLRQIGRVSSGTSKQSKQLLGGLIGDHAILLVGNADGRVWTDLDHRVNGPATRPGIGATQLTRLSDGSEWIGATAAVRNAPWLVWVALPASFITGQTRPFLLAMVLVDLLVIVAGAFGAWLLSRHLISPLGALTTAAEELATGEYGVRVAVTRNDEVGRLAKTFNEMAGAIELASHELQEQAVELETQQAELEESNEALLVHVSEATTAREAAERARARAAAIVDGAMDAVITADADGTIREFNAAAEHVFGYAASEIVGSRLQRLIPVLELRPEAANGGGHGVRMEVTAVRANGQEFPEELAMTHVPVPDRPLVTCFVRDLSDHKQLEAQLQQSQKMEAVGRLAGGIAHDFNNILTVIISYSDLVLADEAITDPARGDLVQVRSAADRAAALTRQLLAFSRKQVLHPIVLDINTVVDDVAKMLTRVMPENIRLSLRLGDPLNSIYADRGQLEQVLMNLAVNARDAMPKGGSLTIETDNAMLDKEYVAMHPGGSDGPHVVLCVHDTGIGMDAKTRDRIFEPFFTTKGVGQGTGLGLATVYGIVRQSGGSIYVYSEPGRGTTFKIYFPMYVGDDAVQDEPAATRPTSTESMTVLLVEDDPAVREATRLVLERLGHEVVPATDVAAALEILRSDGKSLDVVLTDAVMPGQSGLDLAAILRAERPELPIILMSGYTEEAVSGGRALAHDIVFVEKPFTRDAIRRALEDVRTDAAPIGK